MNIHELTPPPSLPKEIKTCCSSPADRRPKKKSPTPELRIFPKSPELPSGTLTISPRNFTENFPEAPDHHPKVCYGYPDTTLRAFLKTYCWKGAVSGRYVHVCWWALCVFFCKFLKVAKPPLQKFCQIKHTAILKPGWRSSKTELL